MNPSSKLVASLFVFLNLDLGLLLVKWVPSVHLVLFDFILQLSRIQNILPPNPSAIQSLFGSLQATNGKEIVIAVKHNTYAISWLAVNQAVSDQCVMPFKLD